MLRKLHFDHKSFIPFGPNIIHNPHGIFNIVLANNNLVPDKIADSDSLDSATFNSKFEEKQWTILIPKISRIHSLLIKGLGVGGNGLD